MNLRISGLRLLITAFAVSYLLGSAQGLAQNVYTVTTIDVPNAVGTIAYGINDAGQIVLRAEGGNSVPEHRCTWLPLFRRQFQPD